MPVFGSIIMADVIASLKYMLFGMAGIFIITAIIIACIFALNKLTSGKKED